MYFTLLESELFGYEDGAFTGARKGGSIGKFEAAVGGTIFLDEINSMSLEMQAKLLRVIQNKTVTHVGGNEEIPVNVRIIAATNIDLWQMVKEEKFREDLYYRINVICISVPPLRERQGDTEVLIYDILPQISSRLNQQLLIDRGAVDLLKRYSWPGNVRELENCALYYMTLGKLPEQFHSKELMQTGERDQDIQEKIKNSVLEILFKRNSLGHGTGRMTVLELLRKEENDISDVQLRVILAELQQQGLITIGRGRQGMKLTEEGMKAIGR